MGWGEVCDDTAGYGDYSEACEGAVATQFDVRLRDTAVGCLVVLRGESHEGEECGNAPLVHSGPVSRVVAVAFRVEGDDGLFGRLWLLCSHDTFEDGFSAVARWLSSRFSAVLGLL